MAENPGKSPPAQASDAAKREEEVLAYWKQNNIFEKSLAKNSPQGEFVFYDGPPFATGLPHTGSLLSSIIKDVVPRYKTMQGYHVPRRWGWDCHGLPIESLVEKRLELKTKKDIERVGIATFNEAARSSVLEFEKEWEAYVDRVGRWVDFKHSYKTMDNSYIEAVWGALKSMYERDLLYEGRKVLMYCPHCETPLAKAEIAMDNTYKDITEEAVTVKFKVKNPDTHGLPENTFLLAWTTTPWTLPGNVALAVSKDISYAKISFSEETYVLAKDRVTPVLTERGGFNGAEVGFVKGTDLVGIEYEPLFDVPAAKSEKAYKVYPADFVTTTEGTGIVHTAVMYGEDDFRLGEKESLPMIQMLNPNGTYNDQAPEFVRGKYIKDAERDIKRSLEERGLLFDRKNHTHSYPHCYRCGTPLIYNAVASWFIDIQKVKDKMLSENEKIEWVPEHLKRGRFKNIVESAPDWTISRNRFWASPLPIWKEKGGERLMVIGSLKELREKAKRSGNRYFLMRHGEAENNLKQVVTSDPAAEYPLTEAGKKAVRESAQQLKDKKIDIIFVSPVKRTQETAAIVAEALGLPPEKMVTEERVREEAAGEFEGRAVSEHRVRFSNEPAALELRPEGGESAEDVARRMGSFLWELETKYQGKNILIVSHGNPIWMVQAAAAGETKEEAWKRLENEYPGRAEVRELDFAPLPVNTRMELDLHRPYIDYITLVDEEGREYERIPEVVDCWVESGSMPFAQNHTLGVPIAEPPVADFIAEYIAQTRTWFYYMHAMGALMFDRRAFNAVVSTGTILAADGSKMSKSKGNYTDPMHLMERFGADAVRFHLMQSVVMQAEDLKFKDEDVREAHNRVIGILWNTFKFFELYKHEWDMKTAARDSDHPLDRWILSRLNQLIDGVTQSMDRYDLPAAARAMRAFVDDYSTWYVRRSRERVKGEDVHDRQFTLATQREVLLTFGKLIAPIMPFLAESLYRGLGGELESVHLEAWPKAGSVDEEILNDMAGARALASKALELRERAGLKIRQPLALLKARTLPKNEGIRAIIADEVNVKKLEEQPDLVEEAWLDSELTQDLREEGWEREIARAVQNWRKEHKFSVNDRPRVKMLTDEKGEAFLSRIKERLLKETGLASLDIEVSPSVQPAGALPFALEILNA